MDAISAPGDYIEPDQFGQKLDSPDTGQRQDLARSGIRFSISPLGSHSMSRQAMSRQASSAQGGVKAMLPALALLFTSAFGIGAMAYGSPAADAQMAVFGPPWWKADRMIGLVVAAGGRIVDTGALPNVMIVRRAPDGERGADEPADLAAALYASGAWLVLDAPALRSCLGILSAKGGAV